MRSIGDAIRPATDMAAQGLTKVARGITSLSDQFPSIAMGIGGITAAVIAFLSARSALRVGRGVFNIAMGRGLEGLAGRAGKAERAPIKLPKTGSKVVDTGLGLLGKVFSRGSKVPGQADDPGAAANDTQRVFVVNADAFGGIGSSVANNGPAGPARGSRRSRRRERRRAARRGVPSRPAPAVEAPKAAVAKVKPLPAALSALTATDDLGKVARSVRGITRLTKRLPGGNIMDAGTAALDVALNAKSQDEKAEGYGGAAGSLAGTLAGAAAGAAIGSVVPVIGTAVGGAVGAVLGGIGGESFGGWLGKRWFGDEPADDHAEPESPPALGEALRVTVMPAKEVEPEPATAPIKADPAPAMGNTVRNTAKSAPEPVEPVVTYDPRDPASKDPFVLPALTVDKVRFPGADLVRPQVNPESPAAPAAPKAPPEPSVPKLGDTVRVVATPVPAEPAVSYDPRDRASKDPFLLPALAANKVRFPGAGLVRPQAEPEPKPESAAPELGAAVREAAPAPTPVPAKPEVSYDPRHPASKDPFLVPALVANKVRLPGADLVRPQLQAQPAGTAGLGDVVREMAKAAPPPKLPDVAQPAKTAGPPPAPKVDQKFSFSPTIKVDVQGDVKDPVQLVRAMEAPLRNMFEAFQREVASRMSSAQLFDQPHV